MNPSSVPELMVIKWLPMEFDLSPGVLLELRNYLEQQRALGVWKVAVSMERGARVAMQQRKTQALESSLHLDAWFDLRVIDGTIVLESEARQFATERGLALLQEITQEHACTNEKIRRLTDLLSALM